MNEDRPFGEPIVVRFSGELDVSRYAELRDRLNSTWDGVSPVVVDLRTVSLIDSTCLSELLLFRRRVQRVKAAFSTLVTDPSVSRLLDITGLKKSLNVVRDEGAALVSQRLQRDAEEV